MGKAGLIGAVVVLGLVGFGIWGAMFYDPEKPPAIIQNIVADRENPQSPQASDELDVGTIESQIHTLINEQRIEAGLAPFNYDAKLATIARDHSLNMANFNFVSHRDQNSDEPPQRYFDAGYVCPFGAPENIYYYGAESEDFAELAVDSWMNSKDHRANILTAQLRNEGIGVAIGENGMYATQNFC